MSRTLVIGFGNIDRADDGAAFFVINALRRRLGQNPLNEDETGLEELGAKIDSVFLSQLTPELLETLAGYQQVIFVDGKKLTEGVLNRVEAAIRCYDPCLSCATHAMGKMPLEITLVAADGTVLDRISRS